MPWVTVHGGHARDGGSTYDRDVSYWRSGRHTGCAVVNEACLISCCGWCYTEKATPARHRPERQHNARSNRRKQRSPNETILQPDTPAQKANYSYKWSHPTPNEADAHTLWMVKQCSTVRLRLALACGD